MLYNTSFQAICTILFTISNFVQVYALSNIHTLDLCKCLMDCKLALATKEAKRRQNADVRTDIAHPLYAFSLCVIHLAQSAKANTMQCTVCIG